MLGSPKKFIASKTDHNMANYLHQNDLPEDFQAGSSIAIDTETTGLSPMRDRLCLIQLSNGDGNAHLIQFSEGNYAAPHLRKLLSDPNIEKIFHFARFDLMMIRKWFGIDCKPVYCTKIGSKLARTYTDRHGLKDLTRELLGLELSKKQQSSDWAAETLSEDQINYAASDVLYLHRLREKLQLMLQRERRDLIAKACFDFLNHRAELDLLGWEQNDIFAHSG